MAETSRPNSSSERLESAGPEDRGAPPYRANTEVRIGEETGKEKTRRRELDL